MTTVIRLQPSKSGNSITVTLNTSARFQLPIDYFVLQKIRVGDELTGDQIDNFTSQSQSHLLREYALRQLAISPKGQAVMLAKLSQALKKINHTYGYKSANTELIPKTIVYLNDKQLINDKDYCLHILRKHKGKSTRFLEYYLKQQGIAETTVQDVLHGRDNNEESDALKKFISKKISRYQKLPNHTIKSKLLANAFQNGFSLSKAKSVIDELLAKR